MSEKPEVNSIIEGKIVKIKPFGAIVQLPDHNQGLVHISHISSKYVQDINEYVNVGDMVKVKVLSIEEESGKISLSMKDAEPPSAEPVQNREYSQQSNQNYRQSDATMPPSFEDKFKDWVKMSNERQAGLSKRNKRR